ncbi:MAG TPA: hypothetical protein VGR26_16230, partial [Acidimicrobiales bacterium]|nr:hypothetical protein [Acidimicrobiales bacterium]
PAHRGRDPDRSRLCRRYYERKLTEGKTKKEALRASSAASPTPCTASWAPMPSDRWARVGKRGRLLKPA